MKSIILALVGVAVMGSAAVAQDVRHETVVHKTVLVHQNHERTLMRHPRQPERYRHPWHPARHVVQHHTVVTRVETR